MDKIITLCRNNDFRRIYNRGKSHVTPVCVIYVSRNRTKNVRIGITTSKKIGNAVKRNRARRVIKEALREIYPNIKPGYDIVIVARGKTPFVKSTDIKKHINKQLGKAGLL